jgi:hypothetical protein
MSAASPWVAIQAVEVKSITRDRIITEQDFIMLSSLFTDKGVDAL